MSTPNVVLHPLALLNITQSATHATLSDLNGTPHRSLGVLLGIRTRDETIVRTSFEVPEGPETVDKALHGARLQSEVYKEYVIVGWYLAAANCDPCQPELELHQRVCPPPLTRSSPRASRTASCSC